MDQIFLTINSWMSQGLLIGGAGCFLWGMVSVLFSPCHLASIPLLVSSVAGRKLVIEGRKAVFYAVVFTSGLFITIATIGVSRWRRGSALFAILQVSASVSLGAILLHSR